MAVTSPFFYGAFSHAGQRGNVTPPRHRMTVEKLRRFSETSIPRRFVNYYRSQISMLDWWLVPREGVKPNRADERRRRQVVKLLEGPNADTNWNTFIEQVIEEMCVVGVAPVEVKTLKRREKANINDDLADAPNHMMYAFDGSSLSYVVDWDGSPSAPRYVQMLPDGKIVPFTNGELIPMRFTSRASTPHGLGPMEVAYHDIEQFLDAGAFAGRTASNAQAKKALFLKGANIDQIEALRKYWRDEIDGSGALPIIGGEDATTLELGLITDQNLFLQWQTFKIAVIASAFGIDAAKANVIAGLNRSTGDKMDDTTDEGAIKPLADTIAQYVNQYILPRYDLSDVYEFRFIYTAISDQKALSVMNQLELQDDSATINEARMLRGRGPLVHPVTGEDIGNVTLSTYRELVKVPEFRVKGFAGLEEALERARTMEDAKTSPGGDFGTNSNNTSDDPTKRGGNGVNSAKKPADDKPMNQRNDSALDV